MKERYFLNSHRLFTMCAMSLCVSLILSTTTGRSDAQGSDAESTGVRQDSEKVIKKAAHSNEPVRIVKVKNKKGELALGKRFRDDADAGWLRGLTLTVENTSGRAITHLNVLLLFPTDANHSTSELAYAFDLMYGVSPQEPHYQESRRRRPDRVLRHGERLDLTLSDEEYEHIQRVLNQRGYPPDLREVLIRLYEVGFDDGTGWLGGVAYDFRGR